MSDPTIISRYTRAEAIEDGTLVNLTAAPHWRFALRAGTLLPLSMTSNAYAETVQLTPDAELAGATEDERLRHLLARLHDAIRRAPPEDTMVTFTVQVMRDDCRASSVRLWAIIDGGDDGHPAMTVLLPEDY